MKAFLVTGQITYVPDNYAPFLDELFRTHKDCFTGLILLQNLNLEVTLKAMGIYALGAKNIGADFLKNIAASKLGNDPRKRICRKYNIPIYPFNNMNEKAAIDLVKAQNIDLVVNARTRCIYKQEILAAPRLGCLNIHHGLLPEYRGTSCDLYALHENRTAGFSIHKMEKKLDDGAILKRCEVNYSNKNYREYLNLSAKQEALALGEVLTHIKHFDCLPQPLVIEENRAITYSKTPTKKQIKEMLQKGMIL